MSAEAAESPGAAAERLKRHDSLYGDAEKVSHDKYHGSGVRISLKRHAVAVSSFSSRAGLFIHRHDGDTADTIARVARGACRAAGRGR